MGVLCDRLDRDTAHFLEWSAAQDRTRSAEKSGVPQIVAILDQSVEQIALVGNAAKRTEIALEWIGREKMVWCLHQGASRIAQEPAHGRGEKSAHRNMIAVEDRDEVPESDGQ